MSRDDVKFQEVVDRTVVYPVGSPTINKISNYLEDRSRALPVSTDPDEDGKYFLPTTYGAHKWYNVGSSMDFTVKGSTGTRFTITGKSATGDYTWPLRTHGLDVSVRPYRVELPNAVSVSAQMNAMAALKIGPNVAVIAAEMNKSLRSFAVLFKVLKSVLRTRKLKSSPEEWAAWWLTYRYTIMTTVQDIYDVAEGVTNILNRPEFLVGEASAVDPDFSIWTAAPTNWYAHKQTGQFRRGCNVRVVARVSNPTLYALDAFGLLNPADLLWELLPYSFVVDWFISIGPWIKSLTAPIGMTFSNGYETRWLKYAYQISYLPRAKIVNTTATVRSEASLSGGVDAFSRNALSGFPRPFVAIDLHLSVKQCLDALSLLTGIAGNQGHPHLR